MRCWPGCNIQLELESLRLEFLLQRIQIFLSWCHPSVPIPFLDELEDLSLFNCTASLSNPYHGSPTLISTTCRLLATVIIDDPANAFFVVINNRSSSSDPVFSKSSSSSSSSFDPNLIFLLFLSFSPFLLFHLQICCYGTRVSETQVPRG